MHCFASKLQPTVFKQENCRKNYQIMQLFMEFALAKVVLNPSQEEHTKIVG